VSPARGEAGPLLGPLGLSVLEVVIAGAVMAGRLVLLIRSTCDAKTLQTGYRDSRLDVRLPWRREPYSLRVLTAWGLSISALG
jgi:hypothetical protein